MLYLSSPAIEQDNKYSRVWCSSSAAPPMAVCFTAYAVRSHLRQGVRRQLPIFRQEVSISLDTGGAERIRTADALYARAVYRTIRTVALPAELLPHITPAVTPGPGLAGKKKEEKKRASANAEWRARPESNRQPSAVLRMCLPKDTSRPWCLKNQAIKYVDIRHLLPENAETVYGESSCVSRKR